MADAIKLIKTNSFKYTVLGILFGGAFPITAAFILSIETHVSFFNALFERPSLALHLIDTAPVFLGFFACIAGRKQDKIQGLYLTTKRDLSYSENVSQKIIENNPAALFCKDYRNGKGVFVEWNAAAEKLWGLKRNDVLGKTDYDFFSQEQADLFFKKDIEILKNGCLTTIDRETINSPINGPLEIRTWKVAIKDESGYQNHLLGISLDITKYTLLEKQLIEAKEAAEVAAQTKSRFLANMSHEIRTPLNGILGMVSLLSSQPLDDQTKKKLDIIKHCGSNLLKLVNDILDFSKIEAKKITLDPTTVSLDETIREVVDLLKPTAEEKDLTLFYRNDSIKHHWVLIDHSRLQQVLLNLIGNAIKFTPNGSVTVNVTAQSLASGFEKIDISVADTGIGMKTEDQHNLFQPFSQMDGSTTRKFGGTGLGLAISREIIEAMGGKISVESRSHHGTTFYFSVLCQKSSSPIEKGSKEEDFDPDLASKKPFKILVVDDQMPNRLLAASFLEMLGYQADCVCNGLEALDAFNTKKYDVIFMDCQMPEMDGFQASIRIKERFSKGQKPWIIALTASAYSEDKEKCFAHGMDDFIAKPFRVTCLSQALNRAKHEVFPGNLTTFNQRSIEEPLFDADLMRRQFQGESQIMKIIIDDFFKNYRGSLERIRNGVENADYELIQMEAHKLRGNIGNFFAKKPQNKLLELETLARQSSQKGAKKILREVEIQLSHLESNLKKLVSEEAA